MPSIRLGMMNLPLRWNSKSQVALHRLGYKNLQHVDCDCHIFGMLSKQILGTCFRFSSFSETSNRVLTHPNNLQGFAKQRCEVEFGSKQLFSHAFSSSRKFSTRSPSFLTCIWMQIKWKLTVENYCTEKLSCCAESEKEREHC